MVGAIFGLCFWFGYPVVSKYYHAAKKDTPDNKTASTFTPHTEVANPNKTIADQVKEQAAFAGLTPEQYADLMNPEKRNTELQARNDVRMDTIAVKYNPNHPYDVDVSEIKYEVTAKPVFSGCMRNMVNMLLIPNKVRFCMM
ncbi:zonular occludens toxin domain protein [Acinetobacter sp. 1592897]|nr:zonular occludens toxin domain protein [Acinetobacter sp. 1592897]